MSFFPHGFSCPVASVLREMTQRIWKLGLEDLGSLVCSFILNVFIQHLLCARHCAGLRGCVLSGTDPLGPYSVTGRHRWSSQHIGCSEGLQDLGKALKGAQPGLVAVRFPPGPAGRDEAVRADGCGERKGISAKEILWLKTGTGKADTDFEKVKGQDPVVWGGRERVA